MLANPLTTLQIALAKFIAAVAILLNRSFQAEDDIHPPNSCILLTTEVRGHFIPSNADGSSFICSLALANHAANASGQTFGHQKGCAIIDAIEPNAGEIDSSACVGKLFIALVNLLNETANVSFIIAYFSPAIVHSVAALAIYSEVSLIPLRPFIAPCRANFIFESPAVTSQRKAFFAASFENLSYAVFIP